MKLLSDIKTRRVSRKFDMKKVLIHIYIYARIGLVKVRAVHRDGRSTLYNVYVYIYIYVILHSIYLSITRTIVFARLDFFRCGVSRFSGWCVCTHWRRLYRKQLYYIISYNVLLYKKMSPH